MIVFKTSEVDKRRRGRGRRNRRRRRGSKSNISGNRSSCRSGSNNRTGNEAAVPTVVTRAAIRACLILSEMFGCHLCRPICLMLRCMYEIS